MRYIIINNQKIMSKKRFTKEQAKALLKNPNVGRCSEKSISYGKDFKIAAVKDWRKGLPPQEIFRQAGFDIKLIGNETPKQCLNRWRKVFKEKGEEGLKNDDRGKAGGRKKKIKWHNDKEKITYLEAEVAYLKAENDFLAKLRKKS